MYLYRCLQQTRLNEQKHRIIQITEQKYYRKYRKYFYIFACFSKAKCGGIHKLMHFSHAAKESGKVVVNNCFNMILGMALLQIH